MPPGLASVVVQTQALFTILFAALALRERPTGRQWAGIALAFVGLALVAATVGRDLTVAGFCFTAASAVSWAIGNVLVKRLPPVDTLHLMVWLSLVPPLPSLLLSAALDGPRALAAALASASWLALGAALYLGPGRHRASPTRSGAACCATTRPRRWLRSRSWFPSWPPARPRSCSASASAHSAWSAWASCCSASR